MESNRQTAHRRLILSAKYFNFFNQKRNEEIESIQNAAKDDIDNETSKWEENEIYLRGYN